MDIEIEKPCSCLDTTEGEPNSDVCSTNGEFKCGSCFCDDGWTGKTCQCNLQALSSDRELENLCSETKIVNGESVQLSTCSDRGDCLCGECFCDSGFTGKYCECAECPVYDNKICGGSERATCDCGECKCTAEWTGMFCECPTSTDKCKPPNSDEQCSGNGKCECGSCDCNRTFSGPFCESKVGAEENALCEYYEPCVRCMIDRKVDMSCDNVSLVCRGRDGREFISEFFGDIIDQKTHCIVRTTNVEGRVCEHVFSYNIDVNNLSQIRIVIDPCKPVNVAFFAVFLFVFTMIVGLIFIGILKVRNVLTDRNEYKKFEQQQMETQYNQNESPLYKSPVTKYEMPKELTEEENVFD